MTHITLLLLQNLKARNNGRYFPCEPDLESDDSDDDSDDSSDEY